jgi:lipoprotein-anchoring transpeptidase ErfK/SrfK
MVFRTASVIATLIVGLGAPQALAQYYPPAPVYPPPRAYPPPLYPPLPPVDLDDDRMPDDGPTVQSRPLPPPGAAPQGSTANAPDARRRGSIYDEAELPPTPPGAIYREPPPGYEPIDPSIRVPRPNYATPPVPPVGLPPAATLAPGQPAAPVPLEADGTRPPLPIGPGQIDPGAAAATRADSNAMMAALPPDYRPETGPKKELPLQFRRTLVDYQTKEPAGTIIVDTPSTYLYLVLGHGKAMRYGIGVGREGFTWSGVEKISRMAEWPDWHPPEEMIDRQPYLPRFMAGGPGSPLGARALYLGKTIYRIHGTNQPSTIGSYVSSGCIRLTNEDVMDLYTRVKVGSRVVVLPGKPPAPATSLAPPAPASSVAPPQAVGGPITAAPLAPPPSAMAR